MADDFCVDEDAGVVLLATHIQNSIDIVSLTPALNSDVAHHVIVGEPFSDQLVGPSSGAWSRLPGDHGRIAYVTTHGGTKKPPPEGIMRPAKVVRLNLRPSS